MVKGGIEVHNVQDRKASIQKGIGTQAKEQDTKKGTDSQLNYPQSQDCSGIATTCLATFSNTTSNK
jgi:hypothetical protein